MTDQPSTQEGGSAVREEDWTEDADGRSNSSPEFVVLVDEVERLIRSSAHQLIGGSVQQVARLIVAQLAHVHGLAPSGDPR